MDMEMKIASSKRESVADRLERPPTLKARMERRLNVVENASGDVRRADEAERRAIEELRQMGLEVMQSWGQKTSNEAALDLEVQGGVVREVKKLHWICTFGEVTVEEQTYRTNEGGKLCRPFQSRAEVSCRCYSTRLQRAITDFGADVPFAQVQEKIREHYGISIVNGAAATITEGHASRMTDTDMTPEVRTTQEALTLIAQIDGRMIPMVQTGNPDDSAAQDRRKTRKLFWKEGKLSMIRRTDEVTPIFAVTLGDAAAAGADLLRLAMTAGFNKHSDVHGLGDGALWIEDQMERQFGAQCRYHVNFFHVCDDLAAAKVCAANDPGWMERQKNFLKTDPFPAVLTALAPFQEPDAVPSEEAPVRGCYRYLTNRPGQFDYHAAIQAGLPIGSGEVESAHRYIKFHLVGLSSTSINSDAEPHPPVALKFQL